MAQERVGSDDRMVDVDLAALGVEVLVLQLRQLDGYLRLVVVVPVDGTDTWDACSWVSEAPTGGWIIPEDIPHPIRVLPLPDACRGVREQRGLAIEHPGAFLVGSAIKTVQVPGREHPVGPAGGEWHGSIEPRLFGCLAHGRLGLQHGAVRVLFHPLTGAGDELHPSDGLDQLVDGSGMVCL